MRFVLPIALLALTGLGLQAGDLPPATTAKFLAILARSANSPGKIACTDGAVKAELAAVGLTADDGAKVAFAGTEAEVKKLKAAGKLVICPQLGWLPSGGAIAVVEEGGKPQIYLHMGNIAASGVTLSDAVLKIGKRL